MAQVTGMTASEIEAELGPFLVSARIDAASQHLMFTTKSGGIIDAGQAVGPTGPQGPSGPPGTNGTNGTNGLPGLVWKGAWTSGTTYAINDAVSYSGSSYRRLVAGAGTTTPDIDTANWALLAKKGDTGATGPAYSPIQRLSSRHASAGQSIANATFVPINFDTIDSESGVPYGSTSHAWVIQETANYSVAFQVVFPANATGLRFVRVAVNGTTLRRFGPISGTPSLAVAGACTIALASSDTLTIEAYQNSGAAMTTVADGNAGTFADVCKVI